MDKLEIQETNSSPYILIDKGKKYFNLKGVSLPEDVHSFFDPIEDFLKKYNEDELLIDIYLIYSNSSSTKKIFTTIRYCLQNIKNVKIIWSYNEDDGDIKDIAKDFQYALNVNFEMNEIKN